MVNNFDFDNRNADDPEVVEGQSDAEQIAGSENEYPMANNKSLMNSRSSPSRSSVNRERLGSK